MSTVTQLFKSPPAADIWKVIEDGWLYSGWVVGASRIRAVDEQWPQVGAKLHHSVGSWPFLIDDSTRVTSMEPGQKLELLARGVALGRGKGADHPRGPRRPSMPRLHCRGCRAWARKSGAQSCGIP